MQQEWQLLSSTMALMAKTWWTKWDIARRKRLDLVHFCLTKKSLPAVPGDLSLTTHRVIRKCGIVCLCVQGWGSVAFIVYLLELYVYTFQKLAQVLTIGASAGQPGEFGVKFWPALTPSQYKCKLLRGQGEEHAIEKKTYTIWHWHCCW